MLSTEWVCSCGDPALVMEDGAVVALRAELADEQRRTLEVW